MMNQWPEAGHIYLSPHLDDAVLSCGGMIAQQARAGERVAMVTVCAGTAPHPPADSPIVRELHARWGLAVDAPGMRRREDIAAARALGETVAAVHWDFPDCIYRVGMDGRALYPDEGSLFGEVRAGDPLVEALAAIGGPPEGSMLYAPLAVGRHVDHQVARRAVEGWAMPAERIAYYEDYPYAGTGGAVEAAVGDGGWESRAVAIDEAAMGRKLRAIAAYESQISSFWADRAAMEAAVRAFAESRGGERLWTKAGPQLRTARSARR